MSFNIIVGYIVDQKFMYSLTVNHLKTPYLLKMINF